MAEGVRVSGWRYMPAGIGSWLLLVAAVNALMVYFALHSFPGEVGVNAFDVSNRYDAVLRSAQLETDLGWTVIAKATDRKPMIWLSQTDASPLRGATIVAAATRPVGPEQRTMLHFMETTGGAFSSAEPLALGRWDIALIVKQGSRTLHTTKRVLVQ